MVVNGCSVLFCPTVSSLVIGKKNKVSKHAFPTQRDICLKWKNLCGNPVIAHRSCASLTRSNVVCGLHFKDEEKKVTKRGVSLVHRAVLPSLRLPIPLSERMQKMNEPPAHFDLKRILAKINFANVISNIDCSVVEYLPVKLPGEELELFDEDDDEIDLKNFDTGDDSTYQPPPELCRTCSLECDNTKVQIFGDQGKILGLQEKIHQHLPIRVKQDDPLPLQMCGKCVQQLEAFHTMTLTCSTANLKLRDMFQCPEDPPVSKCELPDDNDTHDKFCNEDNVFETAGNNSAVNVTCNTSNVHNHNQGAPVESACSMLLQTQDICTAPAYNNPNVFPYNESAPTITPYNDEVANFSDIGFTIDSENGKEEKKNKRRYKIMTLYSCPVCSENIEKRSNLERHLAQVHNKHLCDVCFTLHDSVVLLHVHKNSIHAKKCAICSQTFSSKKNYEVHMRTDHSDVSPTEWENNGNSEATLQQYECSDCVQKYTSLEKFELHRKECHALHVSRIFQCTECSETFKLHCELKDHRKIHEVPAEPTMVLCELCGRSFDSVLKLGSHMRIHTNQGAHKCDECSKTFNCAGTLKRHKMKHITMQLKCLHCSKEFELAKNLRQHIRKYHTLQWYYQCIVCSTKFQSEEKVVEHYAIHSEETQNKDPDKTIFKKVSDFQCAICDKYFLKKEALNTHNKLVKCRRLKEGEKHNRIIVESDFMCETCGKFLSNARSLKVHMSNHLEIKQFCCETCGKSFSLKHRLVDHIRHHTGEKPFQCEYCNKSFYSKKSVHAHKVQVHYNKRNFKCDVCNKGFNNSSKLKIHYRIHTGERPYKCEMCDRTFIQSTQLAHHRKRTLHYGNNNQETTAAVYCIIAS